jgi:hypothetical protein
MITPPNLPLERGGVSMSCTSFKLVLIKNPTFPKSRVFVVGFRSYQHGDD